MLNSIILEGKIIETKPGLLKMKYTKEYTNGAVEDLIITCLVPNERFTIPSINNIVRVVGRLVRFNNIICIYAEHIEVSGRQN